MKCKCLLLFLLLCVAGMTNVKGQTSPYRQYADNGILLDFQRIDNVDFRAFLLYNLSQDDRFVLIPNEESGQFSISSDDETSALDFYAEFETFYQNAYTDFGFLSKTDIGDRLPVWKSQVAPQHFTSIMMDVTLRSTRSDNEHCIDAVPICLSDDSDYETATSNQTADEENMDAGCISASSTYNPSWYFLKIGDPGQLIIHIEGHDPDNSSTQRDIDFCMWGPYTEEQLNSGDACTHLTSDKIVDCSYSSSNSEDINMGYPIDEHVHSGTPGSGHNMVNYHVPETGEIYILMTTNYSRQPCVIKFSKTDGSGPGTTDCGLLPPVVTTYCVGETIHLYANPRVLGCSFSWTGPNNFRSRLQNPIRQNCTMAMAGTYTCTITKNGQTAVAETEVVVYPTPVANFTANVIFGNLVQFTSTSTTNPEGYDISSYEWDFGDGQTGTGATVSHQYAQEGNYQVTLTVSNGDGFCTDEITQTINVGSVPYITVNENGTTTSPYIPLFGYYANIYQRSQFIIPAEQLEDMAQSYITGMTFYLSSPPNYICTAGFYVEIMEVEESYFSDNNFNISDLNQLGSTFYHGTLEITGSTMSIVANDTPCYYSGGNLLVSFSLTTPGYGEYIYFLGETVSNTASLFAYSGTSLSSITTGTQLNFLPKTTFTFSPTSSCPRPTSFEANNITTDGATLTWDGESGSQYRVEWKKASDETWNSTTHTGAPYTLSSLEPNTTYNARVRKVCSSASLGNWYTISFTTACTVHSLPYTYNFEDESYMNCWSMVDCHSSTGRITNSYFYSAYNSFQFYNDINSSQYLISPEFEGTTGVGVSFYYMNRGSFSTFQVGYSTTDNNPNAFTWGDEVTANSGVWQLFDVDFPIGTKYVAVKYLSDNQFYLYLDNFVFIPSMCPKPTQVTASDVTTNSATLSWLENGDATAWQICLNGDETNLIDVSENFYTLLNLNPQTPYTVKVRSACGDGQYSNWSVEISFATANVPFSLPYTYGFEDESDMDCWSMVDCHSSTGRTSYAYHEGERSFRFYYSSNPPQYLISPKFEGTSAMEVSFYYRNQSNSYPETFQVGYSTTTNNPSAFTWGDEVTANDKDTWMLHEDIFPVGTKYVAVKYTSDDQYCLFLDDFSFTDAGACPKPKVTLDEVTPTSVTFSWENAEWCHLYLYQGTTLVHNTLTRINPYTIEGLTLGTDYRLEVMASCEQGISNPTIANFTTPDFAPDGWIAFQDWTLLNGLCTNAWAYSNNSIYSPFISNDGGTTNAYSTGEASMVYATKLYAFEDAQYHFVTCWKGQGERNYDYLRIALVPATETLTPGTVPSGFSYNSLPEGWIALDGGNQLCLSTADDDMYGERAEVNIDVAAGNYYVVFAWRNDTYGGTQPPASITSMYIGREVCATPTALAVTDITSSSATISWKVYEGQNAWEILYKTDDDPDYLWGDETNENPYVFEGYPSHPLQPGTHYTVKIRALCGDDEVGYWSDEIDFFTDVCEAEDKCEITFELTDSYGDGWNGAYIEVVDAATGVVVGTVTNENLNGTTGYGTNEVNIKTLAVCDGRELQFVWHSGSYDSECSYTIYGADAYPYITGSGAMSETASFTVDCSMSGCRKPTDVTILSTAPNDAVVGWTENGTSESWYVFYSTEEGSFNNYFEVYENPVYLSYYYDEELEPATTYYLFVTPSCAVQYDDPINSYSSDEVVFTTMEACPVPFNLSAEPIGGGAKLRWTGYSDSYNVRYRQVGETGWTTTTSGYWLELNYLESMTTYEFQVQGVCDGVTTDWSETSTFTTKMLRQTVDDGDWNVATNWDPVGVPSIEEDVIVYHNMTIPSGVVADANKMSGFLGYLTIEDGGQLVHNSNGSNPPAIYMEKNITGYGSGNGHWYLITNPNSWNSLDPASYGLTSGNYDLYKFDYAGSDKKEWRNYKTTTFSLDTYNSGYLYAHETDVVLELQLGSYRPSSDRRSKSLRYTTGDYEFPGWHLIGNPFLCNAYLVNSSGTALPYYRMNAAGTDLEAVTSGAIAPLEGIFHNVTSTGYVYFTREVPVRGSSLSLVVSGPSTGSTTAEVDNAIISFGEGEGLEKFNFRKGGSKLCIPRGGKDYAVMSVDGDAARHVSTEMPVSFKAEQDGTYTLSFSSEEVTFSYLHLIDYITGADIDLLVPEPVVAEHSRSIEGPASYTFTAKTTDNVNRFKLVFTIQK